MRSLQYDFDELLRKNPNYSSYLAFANAVKGRNYKRRIIQYWFNKLVNKEDYARNDKRDTMDFLIQLSNPARTVEINKKLWAQEDLAEENALAAVSANAAQLSAR